MFSYKFTFIAIHTSITFKNNIIYKMNNLKINDTIRATQAVKRFLVRCLSTTLLYIIINNMVAILGSTTI